AGAVLTRVSVRPLAGRQTGVMTTVPLGRGLTDLTTLAVMVAWRPRFAFARACSRPGNTLDGQRQVHNSDQRRLCNVTDHRTPLPRAPDRGGAGVCIRIARMSGRHQ